MSFANDVTLDVPSKSDENFGFAATAVATTPCALSASELRTAMQRHLRKSGALKTLKTHVRGMLLTELMHQQKRLQAITAQQRVPCDPEGHISLESFEALRRGKKHKLAFEQLPHHSERDSSSSPSFTSWVGYVADAVIENHLRSTHRKMTLSIFSTEVEVPLLSDIGSPSDEQERLEQLLFGSYPTKGPDRKDFVINEGASRASVLQRLVTQRLLQADARSPQRHFDCATQTDADRQTPAAGEAVGSLECRLAAVDAKYALTFSQLGHNNGASFFTRAEVERRLELYKSDVHDQLRREYQQKYRLFEGTKLREVKEALEARYQLMIQNKSEELRVTEQALVAKHEQERQRLQQAREDIEHHRLDLERRQREMRTTLQEHEVHLTEHAAAQQELRDRLRTAQLQCAKWEELSGSRLVEAEASRGREQRRVEEMRRMQADHAAEMRLKDEELSRLRFRLSTLLKHAGGRYAKGDAGEEDRAPAVLQDDLYGMLVRTEELQRNALQQQQTWVTQASLEQQRLAQRWSLPDAAPLPGKAPAPVDRAIPVSTSPAAVSLVRDPCAVSTTACSLSTPLDLNSKEKLSALLTRTPPAVQPIHAMGSPQEPTAGAAATVEPASGTSSAFVHAAESLAPVSGFQGGFQENRNGNEVNQIQASVRTGTGDFAISSKSLISTSDTPNFFQPNNEKSPSGSDASNASNDSATTEERSTRAAALEQILENEATSREEHQSDESSARKGIEWSEKSQRAVIESQDREKQDVGANIGGGPRDVSFATGIFASQQQQRQQFGMADMIFGRDTDDDDDSILFNKDDSTGSSF